MVRLQFRIFPTFGSLYSPVVNGRHANHFARRDEATTLQIKLSSTGLSPMNTTKQTVKRVGVVAPNGTALMPTTPDRADKWIKSGKAKPCRNTLGVFYVQLTCEPSGYKVQPIVAGTDRGKCFTGIAFQSKLATIAVFHAVLPGFYKSSKKSKDRQSVTGKCEKRAELRRTKRGKRIDRTKPFKLRNHRQKRFCNRRGNKVPPSIKANRLMELRILQEMVKILPISEIRDEDCGGNTQRNGRGISPVTVGQEWFRHQASLIAPLVNVDSKTTGQYRERLGLKKDRNNKSRQNVETHGNDAIALAASSFIQYEAFHTATERGHQWVGECVVTPAPFIVVTRPKTFRRKLHDEQIKKGGVLKRKGGTITPWIFRAGDYVETARKGEVVRGWVGGYTLTKKTKRLSIYDHNWVRIGQFNPDNVKLLNRSTRLCLNR